MGGPPPRGRGNGPDPEPHRGRTHAAVDREDVRYAVKQMVVELEDFQLQKTALRGEFLPEDRAEEILRLFEAEEGRFVSTRPAKKARTQDSAFCPPGFPERRAHEWSASVPPSVPAPRPHPVDAFLRENPKRAAEIEGFPEISRLRCTCAPSKKRKLSAMRSLDAMRKEDAARERAGKRPMPLPSLDIAMPCERQKKCERHCLLELERMGLTAQNLASWQARRRERRNLEA